ncbi:hypothetical protein DPMN_163271 [Dreissena polymorpha]|uniref:Uncharacterized protein n=1 Tax=Dreissena polymorpha TaxID=45954 RepID=A0A9D4EVG1_DREPO|nr:hypothetical protein DPMN_163271 [Dreissena polymorpha]
MNVASTVLKRQIFMTHKGRQTIEKMSSQKFTVYKDRTINVASRVFTRKNAPPPGGNEKSPAPPLCGHVFQPTGTVFKLIKDIIGTNLLTKFHEDLTINKKCTANWLPCFLSNQNLFQTSPRYIRTNIQTKFHYDLKIVEAPRVLSREKCPPPSGGHVFQPTGIIF